MGDTDSICHRTGGASPTFKEPKAAEATFPLKNAHETFACSLMSSLTMESPGRLG